MVGRDATKYRANRGDRAVLSRYQPMKAVLSDRPFSDPQWLFERKLDGVRCGAVRERGRVQLLSRTGQVFNATYPELVNALEQGGPDLLLDGEVVAFKGRQTSFEQLQRRMQIHDPERARASGVAVFYYLFDLLELDGHDLRSLPSQGAQGGAASRARVSRSAALHPASQRRRRGRLPRGV